jgi:hypothetical protein
VKDPSSPAAPPLTAWLVPAAIVLGGLCLLAVVAALGPSETVVCGRGHVLNRLAQSISQRLGGGHIDGATASYCTVPATSAWIAATGVFLASVVLAVIVAGRARLTAARE